LNKLFGNVSIASGGVLPEIHAVLLPKKKEKPATEGAAPAKTAAKKKKTKTATSKKAEAKGKAPATPAKKGGKKAKGA